MRSHDFDNEGLWRLTLSLSIPTCLSQAVNVLYAIVDRMFIGNIPLVGDVALAGVGVSAPITTLIGSFAVLIGLGGSPIVTPYREAIQKRSQGAKRHLTGFSAKTTSNPHTATKGSLVRHCRARLLFLFCRGLRAQAQRSYLARSVIM